MTNAMLEAPGNVKASLSTVTEAVHYAMCRSAGQSATDTIELANRLVCLIRFAETHKNSRSFFTRIEQKFDAVAFTTHSEIIESILNEHCISSLKFATIRCIQPIWI